MHKRKLILDEIRARVAVAWPAARDVTEEPHAVAVPRLPAFAIRAEPRGAEPRAMNAPGAFMYEDLVTLTAWRAGGVDLEARLLDMADALEALVLALPAGLGGLAWSIDREAAGVEVEAGETRVGRLELALLVRYATDPVPAQVPGGAFAPGFSAAFD